LWQKNSNFASANHATSRHWAPSFRSSLSSWSFWFSMFLALGF
jgi:hypothetical protein